MNKKIKFIVSGLLSFAIADAANSRTILEATVLGAFQALILGIAALLFVFIKYWWNKRERKDIAEKQLLTRLMIAAADGDIAEVKRLIDAGENTNSQGRSGETALMFAVKNNHLPVVQLLIERGAHLFTKTQLGNTALDLAKKKPNVEIVKILTDAMETSNEIIEDGKLVMDPEDLKNVKQIKGIGGWLIVPIIGFIGTVILTLKNLLDTFSKENLDGMALIFNANSGLIAEVKIPMALSLVAGILVILSASYCLFLIANKDYKIVKFATVHYLVLASAGLFDLWGGIAVEAAFPTIPLEKDFINGAMRGILVAMIWIPYFRMSLRVKNTFVNNGSGTTE